MNSTGALKPRRLAFRTVSSVDSTVMPFFSACVFDFCIVGPSAIGSVKGRPSSMRSVVCSVYAGVWCPRTRTSTTRFHPQQYVHGLICCRVPSGHIGDQRGALFTPALCKCLFDILHDSSGTIGSVNVA